MKTLYIVRHAKSSRDDPGRADFDRPLKERGKKDVVRMAKRLKEKQILPDLMLTSPAERAFSTCKHMAEMLGCAKERIKTDHTLYHADDDGILSAVRQVSDRYTNLMIFGHNPSLTEFVNRLSHNRSHIISIPTCGILAFRFDIESWKDVGFGKGEFIFFDFPKSKDD